MSSYAASYDRVIKSAGLGSSAANAAKAVGSGIWDFTKLTGKEIGGHGLAGSVLGGLAGGTGGVYNLATSDDDLDERLKGVGKGVVGGAILGGGLGLATPFMHPWRI